MITINLCILNVMDDITINILTNEARIYAEKVGVYTTMKNWKFMDNKD